MTEQQMAMQSLPGKMGNQTQRTRIQPRQNP